MVGELVTLPVRVGVRATRLWFRVIEETVSVTTSATERLVGLAASRGSRTVTRDTPPPVQPPDAPPTQAPDAPPAQAAEVSTPLAEDEAVASSEPALSAQRLEAVRERQPADPAPAAQPAHVSEEPALVEELAEPGAEDGAGAEVHVDPPWNGYERMNAKQIIGRLNGADAAELAAVELYELTNRRRQTILNAVERELRRVNGSGSRGR